MVQVIVFFSKKGVVIIWVKKNCDSTQGVLWFESHISLIQINLTDVKLKFQIGVWFETANVGFESIFKKPFLSFLTYDSRHAQDVDFDQLA